MRPNFFLLSLLMFQYKEDQVYNQQQGLACLQGIQSVYTPFTNRMKYRFCG